MPGYDGMQRVLAMETYRHMAIRVSFVERFEDFLRRGDESLRHTFHVRYPIFVFVNAVSQNDGMRMIKPIDIGTQTHKATNAAI